MVARWAATVFSPTQITGLQLWYKADSLSLSNNDPISTWSDSSGNSNDVTGTGSTRPLYKTNIQNSLPTVRFDGTDDFLSGTFNYTVGTLFVVMNFNSAGNFPGYNSLFEGNTGVLNSDDMLIGDGGGTTNLYDNGINSPFRDNMYINTVLTKDFSPLSTIKLFYGLSTDTPFAKTSLNVGYNPSIGSRYWNGDVCEIILYDTVLSSTNLGRVATYLNSKWALY